MTSRRTFVSWLSGLGAALGFGVRARVVDAKSPSEVAPEQGAALDSAMLSRVAEVVLPSELGPDGFERVSRAFTAWAAGYKPGVELVHPYGSATLRNTGESPAGRWREQLAALDREARQKHQRGFSALTRDQRRELVTAAVSAERTNRMPDPIEAGHVALALVGWYFATPDAVDLCYRSRIGKNQCRPLVNAPHQPLPLLDGGRGTGDGRGLSP